MNKKIILPSQTKQQTALVNKVMFSPNLVIGTTIGLVKQHNEDTVGCVLNKDLIRICIVDGHWGSETGRFIVKHWLKSEVAFPNSSTEAIRETKRIEKELFRMFGKTQMDPNKDFTPEASFIAVEIIKKRISIVNYGDCRLLVVNNGTMKFNLEVSDTWLGAFSHLQLRKRLPVDRATKFKKTQLIKGDFVFLFTDGIDQCVYEKNTISFDFISSQSKLNDLSKIFDKLIGEVFANGAQDNASLVIFRF